MTTDKLMSPGCSPCTAEVGGRTVFRRRSRPCNRAFVFFLMNVIASGGVFAATAQWIIDTSSTAAEKTFDGAASWFDENNWKDGTIASGADVYARFWGKAGGASSDQWTGYGVRYVKLDRDVTISGLARWGSSSMSQSTIDSNRRIVLAGDNEITLSNSAGAADMRGVGIYGAVRIAGSKTAPTIIQCDFCGPFSNETSFKPMFSSSRSDEGGLTRFRRDLWADGTSEGITNFAPTTAQFDNTCALVFVAPEGSDGVSGDWNLTAESPYATFAGEERHAVSVGATVTGDGVPPGAYVKRIYPDGRIELSQAATATATATLAFGAFHPKAYQRIDTYSWASHQETYYFGFWPMKHSEADEMTVELFDLPDDYTKGQYHLRVDCESGFLPGRLILHNTSKFKFQLQLGTCEVEFAAPTNNTAAGFPKTVRMFSSDDVAALVVDNGVTATLGTLTNVVGTLVKKGGGTLAANVPKSGGFASGGKVVVEDGTFSVRVPDGAEVLSADSVFVASGATLVLPTNGVKCVSFVAESGATVRGGGIIYAEEGSVEGATLEGGIRFVKAEALKTGDYFWEEQPATVPGNPAIWLDVSNGDSLLMRGITYNTGYRAANELVRWADARGLEYGWATNSAQRAPQVVTNALGLAEHVHFLYGSTGADGNRYALAFNKSLTGVRHVFKVLCTVNGTPQPLGGSALKAPSARYAYPSSALSVTGNEWLSNTVFRINGVKGDWRNGYPYRGGRVSSTSVDLEFFNPAERIVKTVVEFAVPAPGVSATKLGDNGQNNSGRERLYECIIYTNALTEAESAQVTRYLMEKWMGTDANWAPGEDDEVATVDTDTTTDVYQAAGDVMAVGSLAGSGVLEKNGAGELYVADSAGTASLRVNAGTAHLRSMALTIDGVRGNPYLHLDASDGDSFTSMNGTKVRAWRDARGDGYVTATALGTGPTLVENALNEKSAVDFGKCTQVMNGSITSSTALGFPVVSNAHCVVGVWNTTGGGGPIIGWGGMGETYIVNYFALGIYRASFSNGDRTNPAKAIVGPASTYSANDGFGISLGLRAGGTRTRMNGVDVAAESTGFTGGWDLFSFACNDCIGSSAILQSPYSATYIMYGGAKIAETFLYTNTPPKEKILRLEAYLRQKWFNQETPRYRPARFDALAVESGALASVWGGAPVEVNSLRVDGTLTGDVKVSDGGVIEVSVAADGTVVAPGVAGSAALLGGGTVRLVGDGVARLKKGTVPLLSLSGAPGGEWTVEADGARSGVRLSATNDALALTVVPKGVLLIVW